MPDGPVAVVGATGFTGKLVIAALRARGAEVRAIGRNRQKLDALAAADPTVETRCVAWTAEALADALRGCAAMVSCAGPFVEAGPPVAEAAVRARVPYCDSTGEQAFMRWVIEDLAQPARAAGVPLVPAAGFDYAPGDLGAAIAAEGMGPLERVDVVYAPERAHSSVGTRVSALGIIAAGGVALRDGELRPVRMGSLRRTVDVGFARVTGGVMATGEPLQIPRHLDVASVYGYIALPGSMNPGKPGASTFAALLHVPGMRGALERMSRRGPEGPDETQRASRIACHVQVQARDGRRRAVLLEGARDAYSFTGESLAELALRMAAGVDATGPCAPAEVVEPRSFLAATGLTVREVDPE
ncbi:MAG TPA: saccharopine dehydrogenase NADP-binding domain-containing protein [Candidatus Dormibacteraeota bacterium]|jgi:short subunit dehydrogenase-like uncharacterized protein|nr:saccharopine dehydrogenase NADP-binding domain-containing protein [Candidatus Dormibacteraeota bacterium]